MHPENINNIEKDPDLLEAMMRPLRQLESLELVQGGLSPQNWHVSVEWKEPIGDGGWRTCSAEGPMGERFLEWAEGVYRHWLPRAHVQIQVKKLEYLSDKENISTW